jgi:bifunctional DNA-binding transcriptional regulator/antitoxin component of YhaV-PrlF toxin-antitoxin module
VVQGPAELRKEFGIKDGEEVMFSRTEYGIQITTVDQAIRQTSPRASTWSMNCIRRAGRIRPLTDYVLDAAAATTGR